MLPRNDLRTRFPPMIRGAISHQQSVFRRQPSGVGYQLCAFHPIHHSSFIVHPSSSILPQPVAQFQGFSCSNLMPPRQPSCRASRTPFSGMAGGQDSGFQTWVGWFVSARLIGRSAAGDHRPGVYAGLGGRCLLPLFRVTRREARSRAFSLSGFSRRAITRCRRLKPKQRENP